MQNTLKEVYCKDSGKWRLGTLTPACM